MKKNFRKTKVFLLLLALSTVVFAFRKAENMQVAGAGNKKNSLPALVSGMLKHKTPEGASVRKPTPEEKKLIIDQLENLPFMFLGNRGQWADAVLYSGYAQGIAFGFMKDKIGFYSSREVENEEAEHHMPGTRERSEYQTLIWFMSFEGMQKDAEVVASGEQDSRTNFIMGNDASKYAINVPEYAMLEYRGVYNKTDFRFHGFDKQASRLKYDVVLYPGANVSDIRMKYAGIEGLNINAAGELEIKNQWGSIRDAKPYSYQMLNGEKHEVDVRYELKDDHTLGYKIYGTYDKHNTLVIDPFTNIWGTYMKETSAGNNYTYDMCIDAASNVYITGRGQSFTTTAGAFMTSPGGVGVGRWDAWITKLSVVGTIGAAGYTTWVGGNDDEQAFGIAANASGEAYITGFTSSTNFPTKAGAYKTTNASASHLAFVTKLNSAGTALVYSTYLGGAGSGTDAYDIALNSAGDAYVVGTTLEAGFPATAGSFQTASKGGQEGFAAKISNTGGLSYATYLGGTPDMFATMGDDYCYGVAVNQTTGDVYIAGNTNSTDFPTTAGCYQPAIYVNGPGFGSPNYCDAFVTKIGATLAGPLSYSTYLGGTDQDILGDNGPDIGGTTLAVNSTTGEAYVSGYTSSANFPTVNAYQGTNGGGNVFVSRLNATGTSLLWSTFYGGNAGESNQSIAINSKGEVYLAGMTYSNNLTGTTGNYQTALAGSGDYFVAHFNSTGTTLGCGASYFGTGGVNGLEEVRTSLALIQGGSFDTILISGTTHATNFSTVTAGTYQATQSWAGNDHPVLWKMVVCPVVLPVEILSFTGHNEKGHNFLEWLTASETNNAWFVIEKSDDGENFEEIGKIKGAGNSVDKKFYSYTDENPFAGISYYRLRQVDYDGYYTYSKTISLTNAIIYPLAVSPNPARDMLNYDLDLTTQADLNICVTDLPGKIVRQEQVKGSAGKSKSGFDISSLAPGMYFFCISSPALHSRVKFVKQ